MLFYLLFTKKFYFTCFPLRNAILVDANLENAILTGADLTNAVLTGATLTGADLTNAVLNCVGQPVGVELEK